MKIDTITCYWYDYIYHYRLQNDYNNCLSKRILKHSIKIYNIFPGVYYQFFISANGKDSESKMSTVVGHRIQYGVTSLNDNGDTNDFFKNSF